MSLPASSLSSSTNASEESTDALSNSLLSGNSVVKSSSRSAHAVYRPLRSIRPCVRVPVLSVKITVVEPNVSAAKRFLTRPPLRNIDSIPSASTTVTAAGSPSGIAATATAIARSIIDTNGSPRKSPSTSIIARATPMIPIRKRAIR